MKITKKLTIILVIFYFIFFISYCSNSTSPQTTTFSGMITLADTSDYSGVEVMLFKPVEIDTALLNLNKNYPGVGIELNQKTEFYWREQESVYTTTTDAQGQWQIKNVEVGTYHIVYRKDGYGWRVQYDADGKEDYNVSLKKAIIWQGTYDEAVTVPQNSFVNVVGNTVFNDALTLSAGTIVEFKNKENATPQEKIKITVKGNLTIDGSAELPVYVLADDSSNYNTIEVDDASAAQINRCIARFMYNPFYFKNIPMVRVQQSRFDEDKIGLVINNSDSALVKNNFITRIGDGLQTFDTHLSLRQNVFYDCENMGLNLKNAKGSTIMYNVFKICRMFSIGLNYGGDQFRRSNCFVINNDFSRNLNHLYVGYSILGKCNFNNFGCANSYFIKTRLGACKDTIDFKGNFWGTNDMIYISKKIFDIIGRENEKYHGPIIDYSDYKLERINWIDKIGND